MSVTLRPFDVGFRREGHLRDARKAACGYRSLYVTGMLAGDPRG